MKRSCPSAVDSHENGAGPVVQAMSACHMPGGVWHRAQLTMCGSMQAQQVAQQAQQAQQAARAAEAQAASLRQQLDFKVQVSISFMRHATLESCVLDWHLMWHVAWQSPPHSL